MVTQSAWTIFPHKGNSSPYFNDQARKTRSGSGSHKNESSLPVVAMEKEAHVQLIHQERCGEGERFAHKASPKRWRKVAFQRSM
jgi:hypothetical protein